MCLHFPPKMCLTLHGHRQQVRRTLVHQGIPPIDYRRVTHQKNYLSSSSSVYTIDTGKSRGTTFKIDTGGYVFSCLFDSGAEISCMNMETISTLGLMSQITPSSVSINTANGDHMGFAGNVRVHFKIGKKCSFTHSFVVCKRLSHLFIIGEDFMRKHYMSLQWVPENKRALGFQG